MENAWNEAIQDVESKVLERSRGPNMKHHQPVDIKLSDTDLGLTLGKREIYILVAASICSWIVIVLCCGAICYAW